jgi:hypothetical protein
MRMPRPGSGRLIALSVLVLLAAACARSSVSDQTTTTPTPIATTSQPPPTRQDSATTGVAVVTIDSAGYEFVAAPCVLAIDVFFVDGTDDDGATLRIRHASPPTREPAQPAMSVFVVEADDRWEAPPASSTFQIYDPAAGRARGSTPVNLGEPSGPGSTAEFDITCTMAATG